MADDSPFGDVSRLENVTAVAQEGIGVSVRATGGADQTLIARNVIAQGSTDLVASADPGSSASIEDHNSNYDTSIVGGEAQILGFSRQEAPPLFVNRSAGNFHQLAGSPTIDAGTTDLITSATDLDGDRRTVDGDGDPDCIPMPDIGADEFVRTPPSDCKPPETEITDAPKKKVKTSKRRKRAKLAFASDESGSSFECRLDGNGVFVPCDSPFSKKVKSRKGRGKKHTFEVLAIDRAGNVDATPAQHKWRVKKKKKRRKR